MVDADRLRSHLQELIDDTDVAERKTTEHAEYVQAARDEFASAGFEAEAVPPHAIGMRAHELLAMEEDKLIDDLDKEGRLGA
jgi:hypothetical protein